MSRDEFVDTYKKNRFRVDHKLEHYDFNIDTVPNTGIFKDGFVILTAWNPNNTVHEKSENDLCNLSLFKDLLITEYEFDEAYRYSGDYIEEGYCVYGMSLDEGIALGKKYSQFAIFYSGLEGLGYFAAADEKPILTTNAA